MFEDEVSLGDAPMVSDVEGVDVSPSPVPESFDMAEWLAGVRPTRRAVRLFPNAHLVAELDKLADEIDSMPADADVDPLIDRFEALRQQYNDGVWFTVEKRSTEWLRAFRARVAEAEGLDLKASDLEARAAAEIRVGHAVAAACIVEPKMTADQFAALSEANEGEAAKLVNLVNIVNDKLAESSEVLTRDFSRRRSVSR